MTALEDTVTPEIASTFSFMTGVEVRPGKRSVNSGSRVRVPRLAVSAKSLPPREISVTVPLSYQHMNKTMGQPKHCTVD